DPRLELLDLAFEDAPSFQILGRLEVVDAGTRTRDQVRDAESPLGQPPVIAIADRLRHEAGLVQQFPETVGVARKVMARLGGADPRIDADEQHTHAGPDPVFQPQVRPRLGIIRHQRDIQHSAFSIQHSMNWLFKEEPTHYSFDELARDGKTSWTGVKNPLAQKHLRGVKKGDQIFYYHTGDEKAVAAIARAAGDAYPDPADKSGKLYAVDVEPVKKLPSPVTLAAVKADRRFASFPLTRIPRLSVMPVSDDEWRAIVEMSKKS